MIVIMRDAVMPECCSTCVCSEGYGCGITGTEMTTKEMEERPDWCPLEEVEPCEDAVSRKAVIEGVKTLHDVAWKNWHEPTLSANVVLDMIRELPSAQSETYKEKLNEIASALSEKFAYMNTCLNERDIILGYLGVKRSCEIHCNTNCTNTKCESHPSFTQPEPCKDAIGVTLHVAKISKHHSDFSDLDEVIECEDAVSREKAIMATWKEPGYVDPLNVMTAIRDRIKELPSVTSKQRWIPCRERLPDREMPVWVSMCDDDVLKAIWRNGWCAPNGHKIGLTDGQVIAWMPRQIVPEPYREEGGDK